MTQLPTQSALDLGWLQEAIRAVLPRVRSAAAAPIEPAQRAGSPCP